MIRSFPLWALLVFASAASAGSIGQTLTLPPDAFTVPLDAEGIHTLYWTLDYDAQTVSLEAHFHVPADNWVALGFSDYGEITNADLCVLWAGQEGTRLVEDTWTDKDGVLHKDQSQDCEQAGFERSGISTSLHFTRKFSTSDLHDYIIEEGTTHVIWASGSGPLGKLDGLNIASAQHGLKRTDLLKNLRKIPLPPGTFTTSVVTDKFKVPREDSTYWCKVIKLPAKFKNKHHIVKFEPILPNDPGNELLHHMKLLQCVAKPDKEIPAYDNLCEEMPDNTLHLCVNMLAIWALGSSGVYFPEEAGYPIGGPEFNLYAVLQSHFHNAKLIDGVVLKNFGLRLYVTPTLRKYDAGTLGLRKIVKTEIPGGQPYFSLNNHCSSSCTKRSLPADGITLFGTMLHTHVHGIRVVVRHVRDGQMLPDIDRDNHYSTYLQVQRLLKQPVHVKPGDSIITTCVYNTTGLTRAERNVCAVFVWHYPRTDLEICSIQNPKKIFNTYQLGSQAALSQPELYDSTEAINDALAPVWPDEDACIYMPYVN